MKRDPYMDNLRCFLIILVVIAHFLSKLSSITEYHYLYYFIYLFHMPLFVFVSGYFSKSIYKDGNYQAKKVFSLFWIYILFRLASYFTAAGYKGFYKIKLFEESSAPWYLLSLCLWYLLIPLIHNYKARQVIPITIVISLFVGLDSTVGTFLSLSRTITFFPFFCMGYFFTPEKLEGLLSKKFRIPSAIFLGVLLLLFLWKGNCFAPYIRFTYGASSYSDILKKDYLIRGPLLRLAWYVVSVICSLAVLYIVPRKQMWFTRIGQRTLSVYVLHILIRNLLVYEGIFTRILTLPHIYSVAVFPFCILIVLVCSSSFVYQLFSFLLSHPFFVPSKKNN